MSELKPCPFCGGEADTMHAAAGYVYAICEDCGARSSSFGLENRAIEAWNTRAERTCHILNHGSPWEFSVPLLQCDGCEALFYGDATGDIPNYCPNCGAKVVNDG